MRFKILNRILCLSCNDTITGDFGLSTPFYLRCSCTKCVIGNSKKFDKLHDGLYEDLSLFSDNSHDVIRHFVARYGIGREGNPDYGVFRKTILSSMLDSHLESLFKYCKPDNKYLPIYLAEHTYRKKHNIVIPDKPYIYGQI